MELPNLPGITPTSRGRPYQSSIPISFVLAQEKNKKFVYNMTGVIPINL